MRHTATEELAIHGLSVKLLMTGKTGKGDDSSHGEVEVSNICLYSKLMHDNDLLRPRILCGKLIVRFFSVSWKGKETRWLEP